MRFGDSTASGTVRLERLFGPGSGQYTPEN